MKIVGTPIAVLILATFFIALWKFGANKNTNFDFCKILEAVVDVTFDRSIPNEDSKSPAPEDDVDAFPPCLQTSIPIPAATIAELVETLNVF